MTHVREIGGDVAPATLAGGASAGLDVADGRVLVAEPVTGTFDLVLVRNWMAGLGAPAKR